MKIVEEMISSVLAYCDEVCPLKIHHAPIECGYLAFGYVEDDDVQMEAWMLFIGEDSPTITLYALSSEASWIAAYRILGLEARDAVEDEREEMMKTVDALSAMVSVDPVAFADLQARNAALVAALEEIRDFATDEDGEEMDAYDMGEAIGLMVELALTTNTEKGGANE